MTGDEELFPIYYYAAAVNVGSMDSEINDVSRFI
jgi:hypothetical protein